MTPPPDHELDALVATKVMGWTREGNEWAGSEHEPNATRYLVSGPGETHPLFWSPTRDMNHAIQVMDKTSIVLFAGTSNGYWWAEKPTYVHECKSPGRAICLCSIWRSESDVFC